MCVCCFFFFNDTATTAIYTLSLLDALPICLSLMPGFFLGYVLSRRFFVIKNPAAFRSGVLVIAGASAIALILKG